MTKWRGCRSLPARGPPLKATEPSTLTLEDKFDALGGVVVSRSKAATRKTSVIDPKMMLEEFDRCSQIEVTRWGRSLAMRDKPYALRVIRPSKRPKHGR